MQQLFAEFYASIAKMFEVVASPRAYPPRYSAEVVGDICSDRAERHLAVMDAGSQAHGAGKVRKRCGSNALERVVRRIGIIRISLATISYDINVLKSMYFKHFVGGRRMKIGLWIIVSFIILMIGLVIYNQDVLSPSEARVPADRQIRHGRWH